jgi:hypothetical protein
MEGKNPVNELIDERILRLLGLLDVFDLDYDTYKTLLKEKLVEVTSSKRNIPSEEFKLLKNEFKRVRGKKGRLKPKKKRPINSNNVSNLNSFGKKLLKGTASQTVPKQGKSTAVSEGLLDIVKSIRKAVESIHNTVQLQSGILRGQGERDRRTRENERRQREEGRLEEKKNGLLETAKKIVAPFESIFDRIVKFLVFTILGRAFKLFVDWASNPKNKEKVATLWKFLKDWWPTLLGAWFLFATPLGKFTRTIVGTVAKLSLKLAKFAIPKLLAFTKSHPLIAAGAIAGVAAGAGFMMEQGRMDDIAKQQGTTPEKRGQGNWFNEIGKAFNPGQLGMGGVSGLNRGGSVFSGIVDQYTGTKVSGAGPDTQFLPIEGGGGAVLQPGEAVLQVGARERMVNELGVDPLVYNIGSNANKPRTLSSNILGSAYGGLIGLSGGGQIGLNNPNFWLTSAIAGKEAGHIPQGQADVAQSIYNRAKVGIYPGGRDIRKIITASGQYQPTFGNPGAWNSIKDRNSAINVVKDSKLVDMAAKSISDSSLQRSAANFVGSRTDFQGESQKPHMKPKKGDITRGNRHNFFGWFTENGYNSRMSGPATSPFASMSQGASQKQTEQPSMMDRISGFANKLMGKKGGGPLGPGGKVLTNTGDKNPHSASDPRVATVALHPDEYLKVFTKDFADRGGMKMVEYLQAMLDPDSNARKQGVLSKYNIEPPSQKGGIDMITLPPITQSLGGSGSSGSANRGSNVPGFSAVSGVAMATRNTNADLYGIV